MIRFSPHHIPLILIFLGLVAAFAIPERRPEQPDPRRRRAWNATKTGSRPWWRIL